MMSTKTIKAFALLMCALMVLTAFTALVAARADTCDECGGKVVLVETTEEKIDGPKDVICSVNPIYTDVLTQYRITKYWECRSCGDSYTVTYIRTDRVCGHDRDSGYEE